MKLLFISIALILQLWHAQGKQSHASFLNSRITWACFNILFFLLPATLTLSSLFLVYAHKKQRGEVRFYHLGKNAFNMGVGKTWPKPWPTLWPTGGRFFRTSLSIALNLCKQRAPSICHTYDSLLSSL